MEWLRFPGFVAAVMLAAALSGCAGGSNDAASQSIEPANTSARGGPSGGSPGNAGPETEPSPTAEPARAMCVGDDPHFHTHDSWGNSDSFILFDGALDVGVRPQDEMRIGIDETIIGYREFTPEDDGDDDGATDRTDIVWQGTEKLLAQLSWSSDTIPGLNFYFKHASTPEWILVGPVVSGETYTIPLKQRWADMPHRDSVSRWAFLMEAYDPSQEGSPAPVHSARGTVEVLMSIHKGDDTFIDPPHPDFFCKSSKRYAGEINGTINNGVLVQVKQGGVDERVQTGSGWQGLAMDAPNLIPWLTDTVLVHLYYNYTGPASPVPHALGLTYHGADTPEYSIADPSETGAGYAFFEIPIDNTQTDSPYGFTTQWEFGVYPIINGQAGSGDFSGDFHVYLQAVKGG